MIPGKSEEASHSNKERNYRTAGSRVSSLSSPGLTKASNIKLSRRTAKYKAFLLPQTTAGIMTPIEQNRQNIFKPAKQCLYFKIAGSVTQRAFNDHLLCARHCARCWGYKDEQDKVPRSAPSLVEEIGKELITAPRGDKGCNRGKAPLGRQKPTTKRRMGRAFRAEEMARAQSWRQERM